MSLTEKNDKQQNLRVFLSYAREDSIQGHKLNAILSRQYSVNVFTTETLSAGEDWRSILREELSKCDVFVLLWSPNSIDSKWVLHELGAAWALDKTIVPVVTEPNLSTKFPVELRDVKFISIDDLENQETVNRILSRFDKTEVLTS